MTKGTHVAYKQAAPSGNATLAMAPFIVDVDLRDGALEEGLQAIKHGTPDQALQAAKDLGLNASVTMPLHAQCLEQDGVVRAMLKVPDATHLLPQCPHLSCTML